MKQQNKNIEELFKDKLHNLEADPGANAWANVQTGISSNAAGGSAAASSGSWVSTAIVGVIITAVAIGGFFFFNNEGEKKAQPQEQSTVASSTITKELQNNVTNEASTIETHEVAVTDDAEDKTSEATRTIKAANLKVESKEETQVDNAEQVVYEKTIDEILAEHQQFLDAQATNSSQTDTETAAKTAEQPVTTKTAKEVTTASPKSSSATDQQIIDTKEEQRRIAGQVVFPNIFTPDLDGNNDVFKMTVEKSITVDNIQVDILNVNQKVIATWTGIYEGWDGTLKDGSLAPSGSYFYQAIIIVDGKRIPKVQVFTLTR